MAGGETPTGKSGQSRLNLWPLGLVVLILGFAFLGDRGVLLLLKMTQQKATLVAELETVNSQNDRLRHEIAALRDDRRYIEKIARTELGMVRDDELVFQFANQPGRLSGGSLKEM